MNKYFKSAKQIEWNFGWELSLKEHFICMILEAPHQCVPLSGHHITFSELVWWDMVTLGGVC